MKLPRVEFIMSLDRSRGRREESPAFRTSFPGRGKRRRLLPVRPGMVGLENRSFSCSPLKLNQDFLR